MALFHWSSSVSFPISFLPSASLRERYVWAYLLKKSPSYSGYDSTHSVATFSFGGTRRGTQGLAIARQALYHLSHPPSSFLCWLFWR
jgi:hypothetical protein